MAKAQKKELRKPRQQQRPGKESRMKPEPVFDRPEQKSSGKLKNKVVLMLPTWLIGYFIRTEEKW